VLTGLLAALLRLGDGQPEIWFGRQRAPEEMTGAGALFGIAALSITVALGYGAYAWHVRRVERREPTEIALRGAVRPLAAGAVAGALIVLCAVGVVAVTGRVSVTWTGQWAFAVTALATGATAACMEELLLRGVVLRLFERGLGTWLALAASAALFGALHLANPSATWTSTLAIAASGGLLLGLAYVATRRLWLAVGLHFGVNAAQAILGLALSGEPTHGLFATELSGPDAVTGGAFGVESSVTVLCAALALSFVLLRRALRDRRILPPAWRPSSHDADASSKLVVSQE
jgi:hypothetical protein